jgi:anaerobic selenocysteine-containing dehydrogenase
MPLKRRDFLKIGGGISLSLPLAHCISDKVYNSTSKSNWLAAIERWAPSVCQACPGGCGILVRVVDDRAVKIEGNPLHPLNKGRLCPKGQAGLQLLYSPNRIKTPMKRAGERGSGQWESIGWDEAIEKLASKLSKLRESAQSYTVAFAGDRLGNTSDDLISRFLKVYGSPNYLLFDEWMPLKKAYHHMQGVYDLLAFDLENTNFVLSFGAAFLTNWPNVLENQRIYGEKRAERSIKIFQLEPRLSLEASRADRWIPLRPGTEGYLALGIASVLIKEKLYNEAYIQKFTARFEKLKNSVLKEIRLDQISDLTGVPLRSIIEIAKEFSSNKPAVAVADYNMAFQENGLFNLQTVHTLNALAGNIDAHGGLLRQRRAPLSGMPPVVLDETAEQGLAEKRLGELPENNLSTQSISVKSFCEGMKNKDPYGINCLLLSPRTPRLFSYVSRRMKRALQEIPFIVSFSPFADETNSIADLILPDTTYLEKWQDFQMSPLSKTPAVGISRPVIPPLYQSKPFESVVLSLAKKMGPFMAQNFPWSEYEELLLYRMRGLSSAKRGSVFSSSYEEGQLRYLEERGWWVQRHTSQETFMKDLLSKGGWQDPSYHFNERSYMYQTHSRRFVFPSSVKPKGKHVESSDEEAAYPFILYLYDLPYTSTENGGHMPWYQENLGFRFNLNWKTWIEINPETAEKTGIKDNDLVIVESPHGRIRAVTKVFPGVAHGVIAVPLNVRESVLGQKEVDRENDPIHLIGDSYDEQTGMLSRHSTRVKVAKR